MGKDGLGIDQNPRQPRRLLSATLRPGASRVEHAPTSSPFSASSPSSPPLTSSALPYTYTATTTTREKRTLTTAACQACRNRKTKCDAQRPCSGCSARETECIYETLLEETHSQALKRKFSELQTRKSAYKEVFDLLCSRSAEEAANLLLRIRAGADIERILQHIRNGDLLLQLALIPESRTRYEFPSNQKMPDSLYQGIHNPYFNSIIYQLTLPEESRSHRQKHAAVDDSRLSLYLKPYHAAELVEPRLSGAKISQWTLVPTDESLLHQLMHQYFLHQYPFWPFFHKDHFLEDLRIGRRRFCSSLLVNVILADACHGYSRIQYRNEPWNPRNLGYQFLAEAKRLWELELGDKKITTIQAALVMAMTSKMDGIDKVGWLYLSQAIQMAYDLNLFKDIEVKSMKMRTARQFTAWAVFTWQVDSTYHYFIPPLIPKPPEIPLPHPSENPDWYSDVGVRYPMSPKPLPSHHPYVFYSICQFRVIVNEISADAWGGSEKGLTLEQTFKYYKRLKTWLGQLPECLGPSVIVLPSQLQLHIHYYNVIIALFHSHVGPRPEAHVPPMSKVLNANESPHQILTEAKAFLETLVRLYYLRHSFESYSPMMSHFLSLQSFMSIDQLKSANTDETTTKAIHSTIILATKGMRDQARSSHLAQTLSQLIYRKLDPLIASTIKESLLPDEAETDNAQMLLHVKSTFPVNIIGISDDPEKQRLDELIKEIIGVDVDSDSEMSSREITPQLAEK